MLLVLLEKLNLRIENWTKNKLRTKKERKKERKKE
jgi:hypothetical protein